MKTLEQLKEEGVEVRITHYRRLDQTGAILPAYMLRRDHKKSAPTGGGTVVTVTLPDGYSFMRTARCSNKDNFCKKIGRDIALGRALKQLEKAQQQKRESAPWAIEMGPQVGVLRDVQRLP